MSQLGQPADLFVKQPSRAISTEPAAAGTLRPAPMDDTIVSDDKPLGGHQAEGKVAPQAFSLGVGELQELVMNLAAAQKEVLLAQQRATAAEEKRQAAEQRLAFAQDDTEAAQRQLERRTRRWEERLANTVQLLNDSEARFRESEKQQRIARKKIKSLEKEIEDLKTRLEAIKDDTNASDSASSRRAITLNEGEFFQSTRKAKKLGKVVSAVAAKPAALRQEVSPPQSVDSLGSLGSVLDFGQSLQNPESPLVSIPKPLRAYAENTSEKSGFSLTSSVLGSGAFVRVHGVRDRHTGKEAAAKLIKLDGPHGPLEDDQIEYKKKLAQREAAILRTLQHPNIMKLLGEDKDSEGLPRLFVERIDGRLLSDLTAEGPMEIARVRHLFSQLCSAVQAAHDNCIVHRDIKPSNIIVSPIPGGEHLVLIDFGIARNLSEPRLSETIDSPMGSPPYMAPEIWRGITEPGIPADIYALGVVLFEMLTGQRPFVARNFQEWEDLHCKKSPRSPRDVYKHIEKATEEVIFKAMEKLPHQRYSTAIELLDAFETSLNVHPIYRFIRQVRRPLERLLPD